MKTVESWILSDAADLLAENGAKATFASEDEGLAAMRSSKGETLALAGPDGSVRLMIDNKIVPLMGGIKDPALEAMALFPESSRQMECALSQVHSLKSLTKVSTGLRRLGGPSLAAPGPGHPLWIAPGGANADCMIRVVRIDQENGPLFLYQAWRPVKVLEAA